MWQTKQSRKIKKTTKNLPSSSKNKMGETMPWRPKEGKSYSSRGIKKAFMER